MRISDWSSDVCSSDLETLRNLREIAVPYFNNVPLGSAMLTDALESDPVLRRTFFQRMRVMIYGGAGLPQSIMDRLRKLAMDETGRPVRVTTGNGATETENGRASGRERVCQSV